MDGDAGGSLTFGTHAGSGAITRCSPSTRRATSRAKGTLKGVQTAGSVRVATGVVSDGAVVPLPDGVDQAAVDAGELAVSLVVTPLLPDPTSAPNATSVFVHQVCEVDADRRVSCRGVWFDSTAAVAPTSVAAACRFLELRHRRGGRAVTAPAPSMVLLHLDTGHVLAAACVDGAPATVDSLTGGTHVAVRIAPDKVVTVPGMMLTVTSTERDHHVLAAPTSYPGSRRGAASQPGRRADRAPLAR